MTREEREKAIAYGKEQLDVFGGKHAEFIKLAIEALKKEPTSLDDAREDFVFDVYNTLDFLPTNNEANRIIDSFDRVTNGIVNQEPKADAHDTCKDCKYNVKDGKTTAMCDIGHRFYMREPSTFYCADFEKSEAGK